MIVKTLRNLKVGDRVRFIGFKEPDPYSKLKVGTLGTVTLLINDDINAPITVKWDDGSSLGHWFGEVEKID